MFLLGKKGLDHLLPFHYCRPQHERTKRWMSDNSYHHKRFWYLPASVAAEIAAAGNPPGSSQIKSMKCIVGVQGFRSEGP